MSTDAIKALDAFGQSVWLADISRSMIETGRLAELIDLGLMGMTSNPTIFDKAVGSGTDYDDQIRKLRKAGAAAFGIYDELTVTDVRAAADVFRPVYERTKALDGGANVQRLLWGSTSTKNPAYSDIKYVAELVGRDTTNTMPEATFFAFLDHGVVAEALTADTADADEVLAGPRTLGISIDEVCAGLLDKGVRAFDKSLDDLLGTIDKKAGTL